MGNLQLWEDKIKERRKQTKFRDFVREVSSWCPLVLGKTNGMVSRFPGTNRIKGVINKDHFGEQRDGLVESGRSYNPEESFTKNLREIFTTVDLPNLIHYVHNENSDFSDLTLNCKSIYLSNTVIT